MAMVASWSSLQAVTKVSLALSTSATGVLGAGFMRGTSVSRTSSACGLSALSCALPHGPALVSVLAKEAGKLTLPQGTLRTANEG